MFPAVFSPKRMLYFIHLSASSFSQEYHASIPSPVFAEIGNILRFGFRFHAYSFTLSISKSKYGSTSILLIISASHTVKINGASIKNVDIEYDYIKKIQLSGSFLLSLINYVLEMARIESGKATLRTEVGDAQELLGALNAVFEPAVEKKRLKYNCTLDVEHRFIICDVTKVREIVLNIISNSVKYTPEGGSVTVQIKEIPWEKDGWTPYRNLVEDSRIEMGTE